MSFDVFVATRLKPAEDQVHQVFESHAGIYLEGSFSNGRNILIQTADNTPLVLIDAPERASPEELEGPMDTIRPRPRWITFLSVPAAGGERGITAAHMLAEALVNRNDGVVYDPQADELLSADGRREKPKEPPTTRISTVEIEWFMPMSRLTEGSAYAFLTTADRIMPQITPKKRDAFINWSAGGWDTHDTLIYWRGRKPCYSGFGNVRKNPDFPIPAVQAWKLSVTLDEETLRQNTTIRAIAIDLFTAVAQELGSFYAAAYVEREIILTGRSIGSDMVTMQATKVIIPTWGGLPRHAMWLSWFGPPYRDLVAQDLGAEAVTAGTGLLLRLGELPADPDELAGRAPHLPDTLTQDSRHVCETKTYPNGMRGMSFYSKHDTAEYIPAID